MTDDLQLIGENVGTYLGYGLRGVNRRFATDAEIESEMIRRGVAIDHPQYDGIVTIARDRIASIMRP